LHCLPQLRGSRYSNRLMQPRMLAQQDLVLASLTLMRQQRRLYRPGQDAVAHTVSRFCFLVELYYFRHAKKVRVGI
jgi:hypothetical protein